MGTGPEGRPLSPPPAHEPFLRAICEAPDDDAPRLVFADWLDEAGDPDRAEFIRRHVQLARDPEARSLEYECNQRFRTNWRLWVGELPGTIGLWAELHHQHDPRRMTGIDFSQYETWSERPPVLADWERGFPVAI